MAVTCRGDLHMDAAPALPYLDLKSLETTISELPTKCTSISSPPAKMDIPRVKRIDPPTSITVPDSPPNTGGPRTSSRPTSAAASGQHSRSNSRSTPRSRPASRHDPLHSSRRAVPAASIVPVPCTRAPPQDRRESLLALHRESCRLFQDLDTSKTSSDEIRSAPSLSRAPSSSYTSRRERRTSSETGSVPPSPIASSQSSRRFTFEHRDSISPIAAPSLQHRDRSNTLPSITSTSSQSSPSASSINVPVTIMEWTSPSSRRAEYEKIDRAGRGVRGLWRKVAPKWCQARDARTPFFEEGKTSREGSVRRFRMDIPDEEDQIGPKEKAQGQMLDFLGKGCEHTPCRWTYRRTKTSPA
ncbi:hypothetical protein N7532_003524 [Penicillium argentinense]|uniref:Uncharacterized protein n=1 Tax=Penicillium argentinense TaxID=1131581 RepID=A0A9W9FN65_9EURO|nr:uncharacterized protein N7532_003524 [Penicillium argentinense]KAJ5102995.1 hypothetical protein N7532_003524 [Penicillium argentinense]